MPVVFVKGEFLAGFHAVYEVGVLRFRVRHLRYQLHHIRNGTFEPLVDLAFRAFDIRYLALALKAFSLKDDFASVFVCICNAPPDSDSVRMLLRGIDLDFHRESAVFPENILYRIDIMLAHITEPSPVIVPVSAECLVHTVRVVRLVRSRTEPEIVVQA